MIGTTVSLLLLLAGDAPQYRAELVFPLDQQHNHAPGIVECPGFPDCNTAMMIDRHGRLWLFWPTILANSWESCLTNFKVATQYAGPGAPKWDREGLILLKPDDFRDEAISLL